jgi:hypothetical protein
MQPTTWDCSCADKGASGCVQANWRGYWLRQRWKVNREQVVIDEKARLNSAAAQQARLQDLQQKLLLYQQKKLAQAAAEATAAGAGPGAPAAVASAAAAAGPSPMVVVGTSRAVSRATSVAVQRGELGPVASWQSLRSTGYVLHMLWHEGQDIHSACGLRPSTCTQCLLQRAHSEARCETQHSTPMPM